MKRKKPIVQTKPIKIQKSKNPRGYTVKEVKDICLKLGIKYSNLNRLANGSTCAIDKKTGDILMYRWDLVNYVNFILLGTPFIWD